MLKSYQYQPKLNGESAVDKERRIRVQAAELMANDTLRPVPFTTSNEEEQVYAMNPVSNFTKGLPHNGFGQVSPADYETFVERLSEPPEPGGMRDFDVPHGPTAGAFFFEQVDRHGVTTDLELRKWESPLGGLSSDLMGAAPACVAMPPAPPLGSSELCAELAEVYAMALMRDLDFKDMENLNATVQIAGGTTTTVGEILEQLNNLSWFDGSKTPVSFDPGATSSRMLNREEMRRRSARWAEGEDKLSLRTLFRGSTSGAHEGPYLSQFLLVGSGKNLTEQGRGQISYGTQTINQKSSPDPEGLDYMTNWLEWLDVQGGASHSGPDVDALDPRFLTSLRDMAAYVHQDQLYQAYLNACLLLLGQLPKGEKFDKGLPNEGQQTREGFATWGGPHLLSLMTEVASRGLKAVRRQKFQIHRRSRPEVLAARLTLEANGEGAKLGAARPRIASMLAELQRDAPNLMEWIKMRNLENESNPPASRGLSQTATPVPAMPTITDPYFLPMAFAEGSPMHPAYGAGHATVAGACVTILKAFLRVLNDDGTPRPLSDIKLSGDRVGDRSRLAPSSLSHAQTIEGELDKLAANISIARNLAGVHYYTDYYESVRMGERIAVSLLEEQFLTSPEKASMTFHDFDGRMIEIGATVATDPDRHNEIDTTTFLKVDGQVETHGEWWLDHLPY